MKALAQMQSGCLVFKHKGTSQYYSRWSKVEDTALCQAVETYGRQWSIVSQHVPGRSPVQCSARWLNALNPNVHKGRWSAGEDEALTKAVQKYDQGETLNWALVAQAIPRRTGIQCQARWSEALDPSVRKGRWRKEEDVRLREAVEQFGCCWNQVAGCIPSRTQRQCRTRWYQFMHQHQHDKKKKPAQNRAVPLSLTESVPAITLRDYSKLDLPNISLFQPFSTYIALDADLPSLLISGEYSDPFWGCAPQ